MKILYVAGKWNPKDHNLASGVDYEIYNAIQRENVEVEIVGPFTRKFSFIERLLIRAHKQFSKLILIKYPFSYFIESNRKVKEAVAEFDPDIIVVKYAASLAYFKKTKPVLYLCDSTVEWLEKNWRTVSIFSRGLMSGWERHVLQLSDKVLTYSHANADVIREYYKVPAERIIVVPIPASIPFEVVPDQINPRDTFDPIRLLLVGREYHRKGVDIAIDIVHQLIEQGYPTELRIVGLEGESDEHVKFMGLYNKTIPEDLEAYAGNYQWADFFLHPARFEAAGIVPGEAAAFGVPTLTNDVGGLATTVEDGVSGIVLPKDSPAEEYVEKIIALVKHPFEYQALCEATKKRYHEMLNWGALGEKVNKAIDQIVADNQKS